MSLYRYPVQVYFTTEKNPYTPQSDFDAYLHIEIQSGVDTCVDMFPFTTIECDIALDGLLGDTELNVSVLDTEQQYFHNPYRKAGVVSGGLEQTIPIILGPAGLIARSVNDEFERICSNGMITTAKESPHCGSYVWKMLEMDARYAWSQFENALDRSGLDSVEPFTLLAGGTGTGIIGGLRPNAKHIDLRAPLIVLRREEPELDSTPFSLEQIAHANNDELLSAFGTADEFARNLHEGELEQCLKVAGFKCSMKRINRSGVRNSVERIDLDDLDSLTPESLNSTALER